MSSSSDLNLQCKLVASVPLPHAPESYPLNNNNKNNHFIFHFYVQKQQITAVVALCTLCQ